MSIGRPWIDLNQQKACTLSDLARCNEKKGKALNLPWSKDHIFFTPGRDPLNIRAFKSSWHIYHSI